MGAYEGKACNIVTKGFGDQTEFSVGTAFIFFTSRAIPSRWLLPIEGTACDIARIIIAKTLISAKRFIMGALTPLQPGFAFKWPLSESPMTSAAQLPRQQQENDQIPSVKPILNVVGCARCPRRRLQIPNLHLAHSERAKQARNKGPFCLVEKNLQGGKNESDGGEKSPMYCQSCGSLLSQDARVCSSCGRPQLPPVRLASSTPAPVVATTQQKRSSSLGLWLVVGGIVLFATIVGIIGKSPTDNPILTTQQSSTSTSMSQPQQGSTSTSTSQPQVVRPSIPPPKFQIYRYKPDGISPVSIVVPVSTSDERLKSLLWLFREKARSHHLKDIGLRNERDGILLVYRGKKCATEEIDITASAGPCGDGYHDDALYQWGVEGDYDKDSGSVHDTVIFDYKDGWQP
jgi:hypothetical protein